MIFNSLCIAIVLGKQLSNFFFRSLFWTRKIQHTHFSVAETISWLFRRGKKTLNVKHEQIHPLFVHDGQRRERLHLVQMIRGYEVIALRLTGERGKITLYNIQPGGV